MTDASCGLASLVAGGLSTASAVEDRGAISREGLRHG